jgi:dynein light intermediate chain
LIRQITIECSERGILLSRIRHTYRQLMHNYLNNYLSANAYAMRTLLVNEEIKIKLNNQIDHLQSDIEQLKKELFNLEDHYENILKLYSRFQSIDSIIPFELQQLRTTNKFLKQELENVLVKKIKFESLGKTNQ